MKEEILEKLKPGEKAVDIQEYFWGENGKYKVYKVILYTCKSRRRFLFHNYTYIDKYEYPFYFYTKEIAESFMSCHDKFVISEKKCINDFDNFEDGYAISLKEGDSGRNTYYLVDVVHPYSMPESRSRHLIKGGIWGGEVNCSCKWVYKDKNIKYTDIIEREKAASKQDTTGETFSYILNKI